MADQKELTELLSEKYRVPKAEIKKAWDSQFKFLAKAMAKEEKPEVRIPYFGIFEPNEYQIKKFEENKQQNKKDNNDKNN